jgi:soluble lytic murein transglycosylase
MFRALVVAILISTTTAYAETSVKVAAAVGTQADGSNTRDVSQRDIRRNDREARQIIAEWRRLRSGQGDFDDAMLFLNQHSDWPGLQLLRKQTEGSLPIGRRSEDVIKFFEDEAPQTGHGARALIAALRSVERLDAAHDQAILTWRTMTLSEEDEDVLFSAYGDILKDHHEARLDMLLWRGASTGAERMLPRVDEGWQALAKARLALRADAAGVNTLIDRVPKSLQADPGLAFERMQWRARKRRADDAMEMIFAASPDALGEAERWAGWRRSFARSEMRAGRIDRAYTLASQHGLTSGSHFADLEWLSGYIALTYLKDGEAALQHFLRFRSAVETPISLGRAGYWEGRAHELLGDSEGAQNAYAFGAEYQTSFYGLLAAERAGLPMDDALRGQAAYPDWQTTSFASSSVFHAVQHFMASGQRNLAEQFLRHMTESLPADEIGSLGDYVLAANEPHLAVMIGKQAARRAIVVPRAYYPVASLGISDMPVPEELALAIARRESEFDPIVISGAGARGLMQVMPATARAVADDLEIPYELDRLTNDPAYNARLGTAYLDELMAIFDGNIVMVSAGYNAGPGRPLRWMAQRGDPRRGEIDIVDWIEHIPFDETRNYVMRVAESLPAYRAQLTGTVQPIAFTAELIARPGHIRQAVKGEIVRPRARPPALTD